MNYIDLPACVITLGAESLNGLTGELNLVSPDSSINITPDAPTTINLEIADLAEFDLGSVTGTTNINWSAHRFQRCVLTGNTTFTFTNPTSTGMYRILVKQDATGNRTVSLPASVALAEGLVIDDIQRIANGETLFSFYYRSASLGYRCIFNNFGTGI